MADIDIDDIDLSLAVEFDNGTVAESFVSRDGDDTSATFEFDEYTDLAPVKSSLMVFLVPDNYECGPRSYRQHFKHTWTR